jgi:preprotein translocase subunit Sec61beta
VKLEKESKRLKTRFSAGLLLHFEEQDYYGKPGNCRENKQN